MTILLFRMHHDSACNSRLENALEFFLQELFIFSFSSIRLVGTSFVSSRLYLIAQKYKHSIIYTAPHRHRCVCFAKCNVCQIVVNDFSMQAISQKCLESSSQELRGVQENLHNFLILISLLHYPKSTFMQMNAVSSN